MEKTVESENTKRTIEVQKLFRTAYMVACEQFSFKKYTKLVKLQQLNGVQFGNNYLNEIACANFITSIAEDLKEDLQTDIDKTRFMSVLSDGSTDKGISFVVF